MKAGTTFLFGSLAFVAACEREPHFLEESFIVRFAADACEDIRLIRTENGSVGQKSRSHRRIYAADTSCVTSLRKGMSDLGFSRASRDTFMFKLDESSMEKIVIVAGANNGSFEISWEELSL